MLAHDSLTTVWQARGEGLCSFSVITCTQQYLRTGWSTSEEPLQGLT